MFEAIYLNSQKFYLLKSIVRLMHVKVSFDMLLQFLSEVFLEGNHTLHFHYEAKKQATSYRTSIWKY